MSRIVKWTDKAYQGLLRAYDFLAAINEEAAISAIKAVHEKTELLEPSSNIGRPSINLDPEHRELIVPFGASGYVLLYEVQEDLVLILAVKHQKEAAYDLETL